MNSVIISGRLTRDPEVRYTTGENSMAVAKYSLAVDREGKDAGTDFINCTAFGKRGEFTEKYLKKGMKIMVSGHIQTGSYKDREGRTVYTTDVIVDRQEFCESKGTTYAPATEPAAGNDGFMSIPDDVADEGLPFN